MSKETKIVAKETSFTEITDSQWQVISKYLDVKKKAKISIKDDIQCHRLYVLCGRHLAIIRL